MIKPTATACIEISPPIPNREHANGMSSNEPPATPEDPQAANVDIIQRIIAVGSETVIPKVWQTAKDITVIVTAAPSMLMVEPKGMLIE